MPSKARASSKQSSPHKSSGMKDPMPWADIVSRLRGLYSRVAKDLGMDPSYVSRVARSERRSKRVENALRRELTRIILGKKQSGRRARAGVRRKRGRK